MRRDTSAQGPKEAETRRGTAGMKMPRYLTAADIACELQVSRAHAYRIIRNLVHFRAGRILRVPRAAFEVYLRNKERSGCVAGCFTAGFDKARASRGKTGALASQTTPVAGLRILRGGCETTIRPTLPRTRGRVP
jgi:hypothetical protein